MGVTGEGLEGVGSFGGVRVWVGGGCAKEGGRKIVCAQAWFGGLLALRGSISLLRKRRRLSLAVEKEYASVELYVALKEGEAVLN